MMFHIQVIHAAINNFPQKETTEKDFIIFRRQDEEEEEALVDDISTSPEPKLRKLAQVSEDESLVSSKPTAIGAKKIVLNRNVVAPTASSEKENHQEQAAQEISDTGQQPQRQHQQQSDSKKVVKLSAFSLKEVGDISDQY
jgi:hypothetical protein